MISKDQEKLKIIPQEDEIKEINIEELKSQVTNDISQLNKEERQTPKSQRKEYNEFSEQKEPEQQQKKAQNANINMNDKLSKDSFETICKLGEGSYAKVYLVRRKNTLKQYALKQLDKVQIIKHDKVESVHRERDILMIARHPNIIHLECTFSDEGNLYFLLEYAANRSLSELLKQIKPLPLELTKYYAAEIISALEYIHTKGIAHRDLKPENILLDSKFHIKITDFGDSKMFTQEQVKPQAQQNQMQPRISKASTIDFDDVAGHAGRGTFVGTPLYVAPEMLDSNLSGPFTDLWALGCIIFQCLTGDVPFRANYDFQVFQMIQERKLVFPKYLPVEAIDIIDRLMQLNPYQRLGAGENGSDNDYEHLKSHPFFKGINFKKLSTTPPPIPAERFQAALQTIKQKEKDKQNEESSKENNEGEKNTIDYLINELNEEQPIHAKKSQQIQQKKKDEEKQDPTKLVEQERDQMVVKSGIVYKKKGVISNNKRKLILTNQPRLYYTTETGEYKADILLTPFVQAIYKAPDRFDIFCKKSGKNIIFKVQGEDSNTWVTRINRVIETQTKSYQ